MKDMKLQDAEDTTCPYHGNGFEVVFYCYTCQTLLCPRCLTKGQFSSSPDHMSHTYLEVKEAADIVRDDLEKLLPKIKYNIKQKKMRKQKLQTRIQALKLELLRQKTMLDRQIVCMKKTIQERRYDFHKNLSRFIQHPVEIVQEQLHSVESDVNKGLELLCAAESLRWHADNQNLRFLKNFSLIKSAFSQAMDQFSQDQCSENGQDSVDEELLDLGKMDVFFKRELNFLGQAFLFPKKVPKVPKILKSWCTIGSRSVSIFWICDSNVNCIDSFLIYYREAPENFRNNIIREAFDGMDHTKLCKKGFQLIRIRKFLPKRSQTVLRNLTPGTTYIVIIFSRNCFARSLPCVAYLQTLESRNEFILDQLSPERFRNQTAAPVIRGFPLFAKTIHLTLWFLVLLYVFFSAVIISVHWSELSKTVCSLCSTCFWNDLLLSSYFELYKGNSVKLAKNEQAIKNTKSLFC